MKKSWIKKGIVSLIVVAIFMAPISAGIKIDKKNELAIDIERRETKAQTQAQAIVNITSKDSTASVEVIINQESFIERDEYHVYMLLYDVPSGVSVPEDNATSIQNKQKENVRKESATVTETFSNLIPGKNYFVLVGVYFAKIQDSLWSQFINAKYGQVENLLTSGFSNDPPLILTKPFSANGEVGETGNIATYSITADYGCGLNPTTWFTNCIALLMYETIFVPVSGITRVAAEILDFFVYYSTNSDSYTSGFVTKGWGAVRDIANIFFIIALLYVAIKTVLGLNVTDNKKLISMVILMALVINFSLFTTKVVIDGSNILAKVFYNNITSVDKSGKILPAGVGGEKSISVGLVKQFDPHTIFGGAKIEDNLGLFIIITLISILMMLYMIYIFMSVALLFVARVVSLWISMIFSPIAFASYTVPFDIPGFGHKEWWKGLFENAMLAPLFIFFLYIIIMFGDFMKLIVYDTQNADFTQTIMKTIIPFAIVFILLLKAKKLAVKYSGEIGKGITTFGAMAGGLALGAATGGTAMLARGTAGRLAANIGESTKFQEWAAKTKFGEGVARRVSGVASSSFDVRKTAAGGAFAKASGMNLESSKMIGLGSKKGFAQNRADSVKKKEEFANKLLDTSDKGKAELSRGGMNTQRAGDIIDQIEIGSGRKLSSAEKIKYQMELTGHGIESKNLGEVARYLDAAKRNTFADRLEKRKINWSSKAGVINAKKRISANKIRKDAGSIKKQQEMAQAMAAWAAAGGSSGTTPTPPPSPTPPKP